MKTARYWLLLHDELPRIGSGFRHVDVSIGRKWVHIKSVISKVRHKIRLQKWNEIKGSMDRYTERNKSR